MRFAIRRCCTLVGAIVVSATLCYLSIQPSNRTKASARLPACPYELEQTPNDGTGGWSTRFFGSDSTLRNVPGDAKRFPSSTLPRCPVHTYFDNSLNGQNSNELAILSAWVRSFWALGFLPVVLTEEDLWNHPQYSVFRAQGLLSSTSPDLGPLIVMAQRGGLFVDYHNIAMPTKDDIEFLGLGHCDFHSLVTYNIPDLPVFHGSRDAFEDLVNRIATASTFRNALSENHRILELTSTNTEIRPILHGLATYSQTAVAGSFPTLTPNLLPSLINVHLHEHFLRQYPSIVILDPVQHPELGHRHLSILADTLSACPISPCPNSCPPGSTRCAPCKPAAVARSPSLADVDQNSYILSVIPHPYTYLSVIRPGPPVSSRLLVETPRDEWVQKATSGIINPRAGSLQRIQGLNRYIEDSPFVSTSRLPAGSWQTWEELDIESTEYDLGFGLKSVQQEIQTEAEIHNTLWNDINGLQVSTAANNLRERIESWNLGWSELWYHLRDVRRRKKEAILHLYGVSMR